MQVVSKQDVTPVENLDDGWIHRRTEYIGDALKLLQGPQGFLVEHRPPPTIGSRVVVITKPHFHKVRQFQVIVGGDRARMGKHDTPPLSIHYSDPSTPYGPICAGQGGIAWFTLRPRADIGIYYMPGSRTKMTQKAGRSVTVNVPDQSIPNAGARLDILIEPHRDGLAAFRLRLGPGEQGSGPDVGRSGGQFAVIVHGALIHDGHDIPPLSLIWVDGDESPPNLVANRSGADVLFLRFPVEDPSVEDISPNVPVPPEHSPLYT